jgi:uncharacterized protein YbjT (DUF2867 family)
MGRVTGESGMRVVVIGGTGHVGTYLVPRLVARGHEVVSGVSPIDTVSEARQYADRDRLRYPR